MKIHDWLEQNNLDYKEIEENVFEIDGKILVLIAYIEGELVIDKFFELILHEGTPHHVCDYYIFKFGGKYYYCSDTSNPQFNLLKYIGKYKGELNYQYQFPHLGIHGKYELCNGSRSYEDWIVKAKFLNINHIGICEQDTLAGTLAFQSICKKNNINYSLGLTTKTTLGNIKFYVKNDVGWSNLLKINYHLNNDLKTLPIELISELCEGLVVVFESDFELDQKLVRKINRKTQCYYQIDSVEWKSSEKDKSHLLNLKVYCEKWFDLIPPVLICDSYYLDKEEYDIKNKLNKIGKIGFQNQSEDQYFKSLDEVFFQLSEVFRQDNDMLFTLFEESISNANKIAQQCSYEIKTNNAYLPTYPLKESEMHYGNSENLFWSLIEKGLEDKVISKGKDLSKYLERVEEEYRVIKLGGFVDYFLITWDILNFCKENDILTGIARGSAGGCLIAFLLEIVQIDPLEYGLLFERFLNEGRIKSGFPDIDSDVQGERRDEVKRYVEQRYGVENVASIGTYTTFKMKAIIKDLCRLKGLNHETVNYFTSFIEPESTFEDLMKKCLEVERLKKFIKDNTDIVNTVYLLFRQQKTSSIHAAGMVITPREKPIASLTPIKDINGIKVTEWEMEHIDKSGFLKQDILGIRQLDKFKAIINLIHQKTGKKITYDDIGLHEPDVYWLFQEGYNEDVFQFGATGLRAYCQDLKPESLEDLIATVALYRPGAMEINAHTDYIAIKNGKKSIKYDWGTEEITRKTFSLLIYQEQIMQICQKLGGFSLEEADDIRSAMGKKKMDKMMFYKDIFIERAIKNGCPEIEAITIWNKMEGFAGYAFNRSHAVAYAITGYISQWFKSKYPLEFWTISLQYSDDDTISNKISEINKISDIKVSPVDINNSQVGFICKNNTIYWSLNSISYLGDVATQEIIDQRQLGGDYFSLEEFVQRVDKSKVNKRIIVNLILSGAFDEISNIKYLRERFSLIEKYFSSIKQDLPEMYSGKDIWNDVFWVKIQKQLSGIGHLNLQKLFENSTMFNDKLSFVPSNKFWSEGATGRNKVVAGFVKKATKRNSTRGSFLALSLDFDSEIIPITIWGDYYEGKEDEFKGIEEKLLIISGELKFDKFNGKNCLFVNSKDKHIIL